MNLLNNNFFEKAKIELRNGQMSDTTTLLDIITKYLIGYEHLSVSDYEYIKDFIIEIEPYLRDNYPIIPHTIIADKLMIIADTHLGSYDEDIDSLKKVYTLSQEQGIDNVLVAGDMFDGFNGDRAPKLSYSPSIYNNTYYKDCYELYQIRALRYPNVQGIKTKVLIGNHDLSIVYKNIFDIEDMVNLFKLIPNCEILGISGVYINWYSLDKKRSCRFLLKHDIPTLKLLPHTYKKEDIIIEGHHHYPDFNNDSVIKLPPLSRAIRSGGLTHSPAYTLAQFTNDGIEFTTEETNQIGYKLTYKKTL